MRIIAFALLASALLLLSGCTNVEEFGTMQGYCTKHGGQFRNTIYDKGEAMECIFPNVTCDASEYMQTGKCEAKAATQPSGNASAGSSGAGIANPASVNCIDKGGKLSIVDEKDGQVGYCTLNGVKCEEWEFFRTGKCEAKSEEGVKILRAEGEMCGGIAGFMCQKGLLCKLEGDYPDASGKCVKALAQEDAYLGAEKYAKMIPTFAFDGLGMKNVENRTLETGAFEFDFTFSSRQAGYGNRSGTINVQTFKPHRVVITVEGDTITRAITDGKYDEMNKRMLEAPEMTKALCESAKGTWNECASACRNDPKAEMCTMQCVLICECEVAKNNCPHGWACKNLGSLDKTMGECVAN